MWEMSSLWQEESKQGEPFFILRQGLARLPRLDLDLGILLPRPPGVLGSQTHLAKKNTETWHCLHMCRLCARWAPT